MIITQFYLSMAVGLVLGLIVEEKLGIICGGAIVSGYLAMVCDDPFTMLIIFLIVLLNYLIVEFIIPRFVILYGKRRFIACLLVGLILKLAVDFIVPVFPVAALTFRGVGVIVPGLIANNSAKQGIHITFISTLAGCYATFAIVQLLLLAF